MNGVHWFIYLYLYIPRKKINACHLSEFMQTQNLKLQHTTTSVCSRWMLMLKMMMMVTLKEEDRATPQEHRGMLLNPNIKKTAQKTGVIYTEIKRLV